MSSEDDCVTKSKSKAWVCYYEFHLSNLPEIYWKFIECFDTFGKFSVNFGEFQSIRWTKFSIIGPGPKLVYDDLLNCAVSLFLNSIQDVLKKDASIYA